MLVGVQDRDNDGAVDDCEVQYGLDPDDPNDGPLDTDGDGLTNAQELANGLNPGVNAVATVIVVIVAIGVILASYFIARAERQRSRELAAAART